MPSDSPPLAYIAEAPKVEEQEGLFRLDLVSGDRPMPVIMTAHNLMTLVRYCNRALDAFGEEQNRKVVSFTETGRRKS